MKDDRKTKKQLMYELTELRSQNAELKKSESSEKYRSLVENLRDVIYELDDQGVVLYISPAVRDMLGFDSTEIVGKSFIDLAYKDDLNLVTEWFSELRKGTEKPSDYRVLNKSGEPRWAQTKTRPIMEEGLFKGARGIIIDITSQKLLEEALRKSEEKYRWVLNNMADVITVMDMNLRFTYVSPSIIRMRGYTAEEAVTQTLEQVMTPESLKISAKVFEEEMKLEASGTEDPNRIRIVEVEQYRKDGSIVLMENHLSFLRDEAKKAVGIISVSHDITDRKRAEEKLKLSEARLIEAQAVAKVGSWETDLSTLEVIWSEETYRIFEIDPDSFQSSHPGFLELVHPEDRAKVEAAFVWSIDKHMPNAIEHRIVTHGSLVKFLEERWHIFYDNQGIPVRAVGTCQDITDRKRAEEELREGEEEFRSLAESMPQIVWVTRKDGWNIYFNQQWVDYTGLTLEESYGHGWNIPFHPDDRQRAWSAWENATKNNGIYSLECRLRRADGVYLWWLVRGVPLLDETGEIIKWFGTCTDIDKIKHTEEQLQYTLESLRKAFGATIQVMVSAVEARDPYTAGHQVRSADLACAIAAEMGLPQEKIEGLHMAGSIHDIGKLSIPAEILTKPTNLTNIEFSLVKEHARKGYEMMKDVESPWPLAQIVYQHHERMNGSGYPRNLKGDEILIEARILAVADVLEAMASNRPYRPGKGIDAALKEIENGRGMFYDDAVADACLRLFREKDFKIGM
ncbi:MAG: PAS domain S-box protein [Desulfobacterales bacterium]